MNLISLIPGRAWIHGNSAAVGGNNGGMLIDPQTTGYGSGNTAFLNIWASNGSEVIAVSTLNGSLQGPAAWNAVGTPSGGGGTAYFNPSTGELNNPVPSDLTSISRYIFTPPFVPNAVYGIGGTPWWYNQIFTITWNGTATASLIGGAVLGSGGTSTLPSSSGSATITLGTTGVSNVGVTFTITNVNDPPHNINVYLSGGTNGNPNYSTNVANGERLNPDWVNLVKPFGIMRFLGWLGTASSAITDLSQLADFSYTAWGNNNAGGASGGPAPGSVPQAPGYNFAFGPKGQVHPSIICYVCNKLNCHPYVLFPFGATTTMAQQFAAYMRDNLNTGLVTHYEYSNEIWNPGSPCFGYANYQVYPPNQSLLTITGITAANPAQVTTSTPHGFTTNVSYVVLQLTGGTMAQATPAGLNSAGYNITVVDANNFTLNGINATGLTFSSGTCGLAGSPYSWGGYQSANMMLQVYNTYGSAQRSRWRGALGGQCAVTSGVLTNAIIGAKLFLSINAPSMVLTDLFNEAVIAPYTGTNVVSGTTVTSITKSATPTVTVSGTNSYSNGQTIRLYAATGMTQINNLTATVSGKSGQTFTINIDTSAFSNWIQANGNFCIDNTLPKMCDDSATNHTNTPATYPTKYSYFTQEMCDSIINGTSTNAGYVTSGSGNLTASGIPLIFAQQALIANENGLDLRQYEGGNTFTNYDSNIQTVSTLVDYFVNWKYDAGTATFGPSQIATGIFAAYQNNAQGAYPAQLVEGGQPGIFSGVRFYPGDAANINWTPIVAKNALGPYIDPTLPATWTAVYGNYPSTGGSNTNYHFTSSASATNQDSFTATVTGPATVLVLVTSGGGTVTSVTVGGVSLSADVVAINSGNYSSIWKGQILAGNSGAVVVNYSSSANQNKNIFVLTVTGLVSTTPAFISNTGNGSATITEIKGSMIVCAGFVLGGVASFATSSGVGITTIVPIQDIETTGCMGILVAPFTSTLFVANKAQSGGIAIAVYR